MSVTRSRFVLALLAALVLTAFAAPVAAAEPAPDEAAAPAATASVATGCAPTLAELLVPASTSTAESQAVAPALLDPLPQVLQPHCCSQLEVDNCRATCKEIAPGCKGQIGCRAGECVCTCSCP